jgi:hypothetical protein
MRHFLVVKLVLGSNFLICKMRLQMDLTPSRLEMLNIAMSQLYYLYK